MTTYLGKSCLFCLPRVPFVNCRQFMYLVISLLVLRAGYGIWLYQFLIIAYLFTFLNRLNKTESAVFKLWTLYFQRILFTEYSWFTNEPRQANLCLRAFRHDKFQPRMPSHSEGPRIWLSGWKFLLIHCLYERAAKVLARLRGCAGSPEPSLLA